MRLLVRSSLALVVFAGSAIALVAAAPSSLSSHDSRARRAPPKHIAKICL